MKKTKQIQIVDPATGTRTTVHEASFRNVWADRGWRIAADYDAEQDAEGAELENAEGGEDEGAEKVGEKTEVASLPAGAKASVPPVTKPVGETGTGDSKQNPPQQ